jgi:hypothetical protein
VARAAERSRYDTLVVPVPDTLGLDAIRLDVACRLHQIDIPEVVMLTRCEVCASGDSDACDAASGDKRDGSTTRHAVTGIVVALRSFFAAILRHWHHPANDVRTVGAALLVPIRQGPIRGGQRLSRGGAESDDFGARAGSSSKSITDGQQRAPRRGKFDYPLVGGGNCSVEWAGPAAEAATGSGP